LSCKNAAGLSGKRPPNSAANTNKYLPQYNPMLGISHRFFLRYAAARPLISGLWATVLHGLAQR